MVKEMPTMQAEDPGYSISYSEASSFDQPMRRPVLGPSVEQSRKQSQTKASMDPYISRPSSDYLGEGVKRENGRKQPQSRINADGEAPDKEAIAALVEKAKNGGQEAFGELYRLHNQALFRYARYRLPKQAAEDAVSETFSRAWAGLPRYRATGAPFVSWLYGIARHVVLDAGVAERRVEPRGEFPDQAFESDLSATDKIALADAIACLPQRQRQVIELKFLIGLTNDEVGAALGKSPGAVNAQQWRALEALKRILEKR